MKLGKRKKGFTLLETIITMAILLMTLALVSPLLNYNLKSLYTTENKNDLQREANKSLESFTKKAMETINISSINDNSGSSVSLSSIITTVDGISIKEIEFSTGSLDDDSDEYINYDFQLVNDNNKKKLVYTKKILKKNANNTLELYQQLAPVDIATNIKTIKIKPSTDGATFENCSGIKVQFEFSMNLVDSYVVTSEVKFRNK